MIDKIIQSNFKCTGCSACFNTCPAKAISMKLIDGFYKPQIDKDKCVSCKKCVSVCPQNNKLSEPESEVMAYACKNIDDSVRLKSSSGGVFSALAQAILEDGGVVYGAAFDEKYNVHHIRVEDKSELDKLRYSKYVQSYMGDIFQKVKVDLQNNRKVLFSGTPCQCVGLKMFLLSENIDLLYIVEVLCHGVPSPLVWSNYLNFRIKKSHSYIKNIWFRAKDQGWQNSCFRIYFQNDRVYSKSVKNDPYVAMFSRFSLTLNNSCYCCQYRNNAKNTFSDFSMGDFWGIDKICHGYNDKMGTSILIVHNNKAKNLFGEISSKLKTMEVDPDKAISLNGSSKRIKWYFLNNKMRKRLMKTKCNFNFWLRIYLPVLYMRKVLEKLKKEDK